MYDTDKGDERSRFRSLFGIIEDVEKIHALDLYDGLTKEEHRRDRHAFLHT